MSGLTESQVSAANAAVGNFVEATLNYFADVSEKQGSREHSLV